MQLIQRVNVWVKSATPPQDKNVGWIDVSNPEGWVARIFNGAHVEDVSNPTPEQLGWDPVAGITEEEIKKLLDAKQDKLVSGENIKTLGNKDLLGEGNIAIKLTTNASTPNVLRIKLDSDIASSQAFKTINGETLLGEGDISLPTESDIVWEKGTGDNSVQQKDTGAIASGIASIATGVDSFAGQRGYKYTNTGNVTNQLTLTSVDGLAVGDVVSIVNDSKYPNCSIITGINGTTVTFDSLPFDSIVPDLTGFDDYLVYVSEKPNVGDVELAIASHAEGVGTKAQNYTAHAEGRDTKALGEYSHAEGRETIAQYSAHAEGRETEAYGVGSHAEGRNTKSIGTYSHVEGLTNVASGQSSHAEGYANTSLGNNAHTEGRGNTAKGAASHAEGVNNTVTGNDAHAEGTSSNKANIADGDGIDTIQQKWTESKFSLAHGNSSHVEGIDTLALGTASHAEGYRTIASGYASHAEGSGTTASNKRAHAEGTDTIVSGESSHAEGYKTTASGYASHAEGAFTNANAPYSHAEGTDTTAEGIRSHAEGYGTKTNNTAEHASGKFNKSTSSSDGSKATHFSIGIGTSNTDRKNAFEIMQNGDVYVVGLGGYDGTNAGAEGIKTLQQVLAGIETLLSQI